MAKKKDYTARRGGKPEYINFLIKDVPSGEDYSETDSLVIAKLLLQDFETSLMQHAVKEK